MYILNMQHFQQETSKINRWQTFLQLYWSAHTHFFYSQYMIIMLAIHKLLIFVTH